VGMVDVVKWSFRLLNKRPWFFYLVLLTIIAPIFILGLAIHFNFVDFEPDVLAWKNEVIPRFIIIATWKGGTTSMCNIFSKHPLICKASGEPPYFVRHSEFRKMSFSMWQKQTFRHCRQTKYVVMKSAGMLSGRYCAPRLKSVLPNAKIVVLLRNPVDRVYSHWFMEFCKGRTTLSFERFIKRHKRILDAGLYAHSLKRWFQFFSEEQFLIIRSEDFWKQPRDTLLKVQEFANIPVHNFSDSEVTRVYGSSPRCDRLLGARPQMNPSIRRQLFKYFAPHNRRLETLLQKPFYWSLNESSNIEMDIDDD